MIPYRDEKIIHAIAWFAREHKKKTHKPLSQTGLYKYLAFLDFDSLKETGEPVLNLEYRAMKNGPVPIEIYDQRYDYTTDYFTFQTSEDGKGICILPKSAPPDMKYFSRYEMDLMNRLIEIFADSSIYASHMSTATHESIRAWRITWKTNPNSIIDKSLTFDFSDPNHELTQAEEHFLIAEGLK
jgi:uncharacterized phage-associated protein